MSRICAIIVFAAALTGAVAIGRAQAAGNETPQQNVHESQQYEQLLCTNPSFRAKRIAQECGPLQGSQFYDNCVASFDCKQQRSSGSEYRRAPPSETTK
jgi:hypothetical protein